MKVAARVVGKTKIDNDRRIVLDHKHVVGADYSSKKLAQFCTIGCRLEHCRFDKAQISNAQFGSGTEPTEFFECTFDGARMDMGPGGLARYVRCSFRNVELREWICFAVELIDCTFSGRLRSGIFNGTVPDDHRALIGRVRNEFRGNDFSAMDLVEVSFRTGIDLSLQRLPSGAEYLYLQDAEAALKHLWSEVIAWKDLDLRRSALAIVKTLQYEAEMGQKQLLLREDDYRSGQLRDAASRIFGLLRASAARPPR